MVVFMFYWVCLLVLAAKDRDCQRHFCEETPAVAPRLHGATARRLQGCPAVGQTKPLSELCSHSVIMYLRKYKKSGMKQQLGEKGENVSEKQPSRHQGQQKKRGRRGSRHHSRNSPAARGGPCYSRLCPEENCSLGEPTQGQVPGQSCSLWRGAPLVSGLLSGSPGKSMWKECVPGDLHPMERILAEAVLEEL